MKRGRRRGRAPFFLKRILGASSQPVRALQLETQRAFANVIPTSSSKPSLFNIDLHISVIADLQVELKQQGAQLTRWSISGHNFVWRKFFTRPDPVRVLNQGSWHELDEGLIDRFQDVYGQYLKRFDGFVVTYPPAFAELFRDFNKPILTIAATRYEAPYTAQESQWDRFDTFLRVRIDNGSLLLAANNRADQSYLEAMLNREARYVPSVCDYTAAKWPGTGGENLILARSMNTKESIQQRSSGNWMDGQKYLGVNHSWQDLANSQEVFVIPYNVSTMTLFELATAGVPVSVPSKEFLKDLVAQDPNTLSEITWSQVHGIHAPTSRARRFPFLDPQRLDWWLTRADFFDHDLMPNVREVESIDQLLEERHPVLEKELDDWRFQVGQRNARLRLLRKSLVEDFLSRL